MFYKSNDSGYKEVMEGIRLKTLVRGEKTHFTQFLLEGGRRIPTHGHPHEQTGYLVSGRMNLIVDGTVNEAEPGDSWNIPSNVEHSADVLKDSVVIEVFSPVREDYLPENLG